MSISSAERNIRAVLPVVRLALAYTPLPLWRWLEHLGTSNVKMPAGVTREVISADGVSCEWLIPDNSSSDQVLLYLHGGGWVYKWTDPHRQMVSALARRMGVRALAPDYRVAPENPFPAPLDDCVTAYRWLLKQGIAAQNIVIAGDSAGGNLTLATLLKLKQDGDPMPAAAACLSPATNLTNRTEFFRGVYDPLLHPKSSEYFRLSYLADNDPKNPLVSPEFGDWHGFPPLLIHAGGDEFLSHDAVNAEKQAKEAGVDVRMEIFPRMWHVWQINLDLPQSAQSLDEIAQFLKSHMGVLVR